MNRRNFLKCAGLGLAAMALPRYGALGGEASGRPNIVWIFSDDHSYQAIGAYGGRLRKLNPTPNIDRLAREGMRFDRCYVANAICAPSRATLLTGKLSHMNGKIDNRGGFDHSQQTFPGLLQKAGYQTALIGKLHLDGKPQGFDHWEVLPGQGQYDNPVFISEQGKTREAGYVTDVITDKALNWLKSGRDTGKPFMLMVHHKAPHRNWIPRDRDMNRYEDVEIPEPENLFDDYSNRGTAAHMQDMEIDKTMTLKKDLKVDGDTTGKFAARNKDFAGKKLAGKDLVRWKYQQYMKDYLRCIWAVDENVGRLLKYLDDSGLAGNTVVMYASDQGFYNGEHGWFDKRFMYEESYRTPFIVKWPGVIKPGSVNAELAQNIDWAETFLAIAGASIPANMQGASLVPLMRGQAPDNWRKSLYYHYYEYPAEHAVRRHEGVSSKQYKLIRFYGPDVPGGEEWEFYDLDQDPHEMRNGYALPEYKAEIAKMKAELMRLRDLYKVPPDSAESGGTVEKGAQGNEST